MSIARKTGVGMTAAIAIAGIYILGIQQGWYGRPLDPGLVTTANVGKHQAVAARQQAQQNSILAIDKSPEKQILFGDFHVHSAYSLDAFMGQLPLMQGEGAHPPADACDYARYCSALDFWSINDHAESVTPQRWLETKETIRQCNAASGDPANPDTVAFLGWEWTQNGNTPQNMYGHKNVILRDTAEGKVPTRTIAAMGQGLKKIQKAESGVMTYLMPALDLANRQVYYDFDRFLRDTRIDFCPEGVDVRELPADCIEYASTPSELFGKLNQWGFPTLVIPHGTGVGHQNPVGSSWVQQLTSGNHDPALQTMYEIYSGHGNSESYRPYQSVARDEIDNPYCPPPQGDFTPMCWQAGIIIEKRCLNSGLTSEECSRRADEARQLGAEAGKNAFAVVGGSEVSEWSDAGVCDDCFQPPSQLRYSMSAQAALAVRNFNRGEGESERFKFALMSSSDNHSAMPGTGYKEFDRHNSVDIKVPKEKWLADIVLKKGKPLDKARPVSAGDYIKFTERSRSYVYTGGLIATHATARDRDSVWEAVQRKEVYGTSGPRILLWFDLLNGPDGEAPMGSELQLDQNPRFRVRASGAFEQQPGCPDYALSGLGPERLNSLCHGDCYNPGDKRHRISRIEVVKITPQNTPQEAFAELIQDDWKVFSCDDLEVGCTVEFEDPEFVQQARDSLYYVRAVQEPTPTVNGGNLRCEYDDNGVCIKVNPCYPHELTDAGDDCLAPSEHRAWSSPIFVDFDSPTEGE